MAGFFCNGEIGPVPPDELPPSDGTTARMMGYSTGEWRICGTLQGVQACWEPTAADMRPLWPPRHDGRQAQDRLAACWSTERGWAAPSGGASAKRSMLACSSRTSSVEHCSGWCWAAHRRAIVTDLTRVRFPILWCRSHVHAEADPGQPPPARVGGLLSAACP